RCLLYRLKWREGVPTVVAEDVIVEGLREVYDPELHYNIYDLGLVYDIGVNDGDVKILMTLTTPACPIGPMITEQISESIGLIPGVKNVDVEFTFDPPWNPDKMSDEAKADLGLD
ncbi:MAG: metal-sulfur cluster assembly factor, partial [Gammaproteobacteria bacterium]